MILWVLNRPKRYCHVNSKTSHTQNFGLGGYFSKTIFSGTSTLNSELVWNENELL